MGLAMLDVILFYVYSTLQFPVECTFLKQRFRYHADLPCDCNTDDEAQKCDADRKWIALAMLGIDQFGSDMRRIRIGKGSDHLADKHRPKIRELCCGRE